MTREKHSSKSQSNNGNAQTLHVQKLQGMSDENFEKISSLVESFKNMVTQTTPFSLAKLQASSEEKTESKDNANRFWNEIIRINGLDVPLDRLMNKTKGQHDEQLHQLSPNKPKTKAPKSVLALRRKKKLV